MRVALILATSMLAATSAVAWAVDSPAAQEPDLSKVATPANPATVAVDPVTDDPARSGFLIVQTDRPTTSKGGPIAGDVTIRLKSAPPEASVNVGKFMSFPSDLGPQNYAFDLKTSPEVDAHFLEKIASGEAVVDVKVSAIRPASGGGDTVSSSLSIVTSTFNK